MACIARFLNQPIYKQGVKDVATCFAFGVGTWQTARTIHWLASREPWPKLTWKKYIVIQSQAALILGGIASRPGNILCGSLAKKLFTEEGLVRWFGPNTIFERNWKHPRHVVSLAAFILGLPALVEWTRAAGNDRIILSLTAALTLLSRPALHLGNTWTRETIAKLK